MSTPERRLHERVLALAATALDFGLAARETAELEGHLAACPACARTAAGLRFDAAALRRPAELVPSYRVDAAVAAAIAGHPARRQGASRTLVLVAATALLLVALLGMAAVGAFLWRTMQPPTVVVPSPTPPAFVVVPSASPAPSASPVPTWQMAALPPMFAGGHALPVAVAAGGSGLVAVGDRTFRDLVEPAGGTGGAWHTADGLTWTPSTSVDELAVGNGINVGVPEIGLDDVAWGPPGYVAVGLTDPPGEAGGVLAGAAWHSSDGLAWERVEMPDADRARPVAVTWTGTRYVAVGVVEDADAPRAAAWLSDDGVAWSRVSDAPAFDIGGYIDTGEYHAWGGPTDVTASTDGVVYAVGRTCTESTYLGTPSVCRTLLWRSPEGETWTRTDAGGSAATALLASVAASSGRVVAVGGPSVTGGSLPGEPANVLVGNEASLELVEVDGVPRLTRVVAYRDGYLALATAGNVISLWTSPDGREWTAVADVPQPSDVAVMRDADLAVAGSQVVIVGWAELDLAGFSIVWSPPDGTVPSPTASPVPGAWAPVRSQGAVSGVQFRDVAWTGSRFVAVGAVVNADVHTFLDSLDGVTWRRQEDSTPDGFPMNLAAGPRGLVAVGSIDDRPASWTSPDGLTWTAHSDAFPVPAPGTDDIEVTEVIATDDGWLAVGRRDPQCFVNCGLEPIRAYVWTSKDGARWTKLEDQPSLAGGGMSAVARSDGGYVAAGNAAGHAAIWTSPDGVTWTRVAHDPMFGDETALGTQATGVAAGDGGVAAVGISAGEGGRGARAWWSADGTTWSEASIESATGGQLFSVTATPRGFLAVGPSGGASCLGGIWDSADGRAWRCVATDPAFAGFGPNAVAVSDTVEVAAGLGVAGWDDSTGEGIPGAVWVRSLP